MSEQYFYSILEETAPKVTSFHLISVLFVGLFMIQFSEKIELNRTEPNHSKNSHEPFPFNQN